MRLNQACIRCPLRHREIPRGTLDAWINESPMFCNFPFCSDGAFRDAGAHEMFTIATRVWPARPGTVGIR